MSRVFYVMGLAAFLFFGCSDGPSVAGTSEEPNQLAYEEVSSSSDCLLGNRCGVSLSVDGTSSSSSFRAQESSSDGGFLSSSSEKDFNGVEPLSSAVQSSSSFDDAGKSSSSVKPSYESSSSAGGGDGDSGMVPPGDNSRMKSFSELLSIYGVGSDALNEIRFDENVLVYGVVYIYPCGASDDCDPVAMVYNQYRSPRLIRDVPPEVAKELFPEASSYLSRKLDESCTTYLLNVDGNLTSGQMPYDAGYVLTKITSDTLSVVAIDLESCVVDEVYKVFGILFNYCGEISESVEIDYQVYENGCSKVSDDCMERECVPPEAIGTIDFSWVWVK